MGEIGVKINRGTVEEGINGSMTSSATLRAGIPSLPRSFSIRIWTLLTNKEAERKKFRLQKQKRTAKKDGEY